MEVIMQSRFEGYIFFVYDRDLLQKEEDLIEDAILYFYPHSVERNIVASSSYQHCNKKMIFMCMPLDNQCRLCGQLMGVVQFTDSMFGAYPALFKFANQKIAVKHVGKYSFAFAGNVLEPDATLLATVDRLYFLFAFYHGSIELLKMECKNEKRKYMVEIHVIWEQYLAFVRNYGNNLPSVFSPLPYLSLKNDPYFCFLKASQILESCQRRRQIIAGTILYNRYILCSQLSDQISQCLLLLQPNQNHHPAVTIETDYELPFGVRLFDVYLMRKDLKEILGQNRNSPYQGKALSSLHCCCISRPRLTTRQQPCKNTIMNPRGRTMNIDHEVLTQSEKDPLSSSSSSGPNLCKAMLEDLILKGFQCCKCIDDHEFEDGSSLGSNDVENLETLEEKCEHGNCIVYPGEDVYCVDNDTEVVSRNSVSFENSVISQNSLESGIEVTGSDFDQRSQIFDRRKCRNLREENNSCLVTHQLRKNIVKRKNCLGENEVRNHSNWDKETEKEKWYQTDTRQYMDENINVSSEKFVEKAVPEGASCNLFFNVQDSSDVATKEISDVMLKQHENEVACQDEKQVENNHRCNISVKNDVEESLNERSNDILDKHDELIYNLTSDKDTVSLKGKTPSEPLRDEPNGLHNSNEVKCEVRKDNEVHLHDDIDTDGEPGKKAQADSRGSSEDGNDWKKLHQNWCEVDGLIHANLFVQAHSEIVLILLAECDLHRNEHAVRSLWSSSLSQLGELDILMKNSQKESHQEPPQGPFNFLIHDNFDKTMSGNFEEPVYAPDLVFCDATKTLHDHYNNASQLNSVTLRSFLSGIYSERTLTREVYFQDTMTSERNGFMSQRLRERLEKDHGLTFI